MGAGIMASIAGGLSEASIGSAVSAATGGIIYGTAAGYESGVRLWSWGGVAAPRGDAQFSVGEPDIQPVRVEVPRASLSPLDIAIADAAEEAFFGTSTGGPIELFQDRERDSEGVRPVVVMGPPLPPPPVRICP